MQRKSVGPPLSLCPSLSSDSPYLTYQPHEREATTAALQAPPNGAMALLDLCTPVGGFSWPLAVPPRAPSSSASCASRSKVQAIRSSATRASPAAAVPPPAEQRGRGKGWGAIATGVATAASPACRPNGARWTPTPEQVKILKELYYGCGIRSPNAEQIQRIAARLRQFGKIEGKNVFYWFQKAWARRSLPWAHWWRRRGRWWLTEFLPF